MGKGFIPLGAYRVLDDLLAVSFNPHHFCQVFLYFTIRICRKESVMAKVIQLLSNWIAKSVQVYAHIPTLPMASEVLNELVRGKNYLKNYKGKDEKWVLWTTIDVMNNHLNVHLTELNKTKLMRRSNR